MHHLLRVLLLTSIAQVLTVWATQIVLDDPTGCEPSHTIPINGEQCRVYARACAKSQNARTKVKWINSEDGGGNRTFRVHTPLNLDQQKPAGLILSFHGANRNASEQECLSEFWNHVINPSYITVYPQGLRDTWKFPGWRTTYSDLAFIEDLLNHLKTSGEYNIDHSRIYATGKSLGGGFVDVMACHRIGRQFAAFAPVSGAFYNEVGTSHECLYSKRQRPYLEFHGALDQHIPYAGGHCGRHGATPPIPRVLSKWAIRNRCDEAAVISTSTVGNTTIETRSWCGDPAEPIVQGYKINDVEHWWPSTHCNDDNRGHVTGIDASKAIMEFFGRYTNTY